MSIQWKSLSFLGYPNYQISNEGQVKGPRKLRKRIHNQSGYCVVDLWDNKKSKQFALHVLVALAFIPNPDNLPSVNHKDGDKDNCEETNLEWVTHKENTRHAMQTGLMPSHGEDNPNAHLTQSQVDYIRQHTEIPHSTLAKKFNIHPTTISKIRRNQLWTK